MNNKFIFSFEYFNYEEVKVFVNVRVISFTNYD